MLDDRKERILRAVVDDYVASGEPVGSRTLVRNHGFALSPATIRNEMADLVDSGYLEQPHASAGRIPSDKGYRYYVDHFVKAEDADREASRLAERVLADAREMTAAIRTTARFLGEASRFLALVTRPQTESCRIEALRVVPVRDDRALLVLVTDDGLVEHRLVELEAPVARRELDEVNHILAEVLGGLPLGPDAQTALGEVSGWLRSYRDLIESALDLLDGRRPGEEGLVVGGTTNILRQPEFRDAAKAEALLAAIEEEGKLRRLLGEPPDEGRVRVAIGREIAVREMQDCSVVTAAYRRRGTWGQVAVVGPKRMDYAEVIGLVQAVARALSAAFEGASDAPFRR